MKTSAKRATLRRGKTNREAYSLKIMELRKKAGWTQQDLARKLGLGRGAIVQWELGLRVPRNKHFSLLAALAAELSEPSLQQFFLEQTESKRLSVELSNRWERKVREALAQQKDHFHRLLGMGYEGLSRYQFGRLVEVQGDRGKFTPRFYEICFETVLVERLWSESPYARDSIAKRK